MAMASRSFSQIGLGLVPRLHKNSIAKRLERDMVLGFNFNENIIGGRKFSFNSGTVLENLGSTDISVQPGLSGNALSFEDTNVLRTTRPTTEINQINTQFHGAFWINFQSLDYTDDAYIISIWEFQTDQRLWFVRADLNLLQFNFSDTGTSFPTNPLSFPVPTDSEWHLVQFWYDNGNIGLSLDEEVVTQITNRAVITDADAYLTIGNLAVDKTTTPTAHTTSFPGLLNNFYFWDRLLNEEEKKVLLEQVTIEETNIVREYNIERDSTLAYYWTADNARVNTNGVDWPAIISDKVLENDNGFGIGTISSNHNSTIQLLNGQDAVGLKPSVLRLEDTDSNIENAVAFVLVVSLGIGYTSNNINPVHAFHGGQNTTNDLEGEDDYTFQHLDSSYIVSFDGSTTSGVAEQGRVSFTGGTFSEFGDNIDVPSYSKPTYVTNPESMQSNYGIEVVYGEYQDGDSVKIQVFGGFSAGSVYRSYGDWAAMGVWTNNKPTQDEIDKVVGSLASKYSVKDKLPAIHPYKVQKPLSSLTFWTPEKDSRLLARWQFNQGLDDSTTPNVLDNWNSVDGENLLSYASGFGTKANINSSFIDFNSGNYFINTRFGLGVNPDITVVVVKKAGSVPETKLWGLGGQPGLTAGVIEANIDTDTTISFRHNDGFSLFTLTENNFSTDDTIIICSRQSGSTYATLHNIRVNGNTLTRTSGTTGTPSNTGEIFTVGSGYNNSRPLDGEITDILIFEAPSTDTALQERIEGWLYHNRPQVTINLPNDHPYLFTPPRI